MARSLHVIPECRVIVKILCTLIDDDVLIISICLNLLCIQWIKRRHLDSRNDTKHNIQPGSIYCVCLVAWEVMVASEAVTAVSGAGSDQSRKQAPDQRPKSCCLCSETNVPVRHLMASRSGGIVILFFFLHSLNTGVQTASGLPEILPGSWDIVDPLMCTASLHCSECLAKCCGTCWSSA